LPALLINSTTFATSPLPTRKNAVRGRVIGLGCSGSPTALHCIVRQWGLFVCRARLAAPTCIPAAY
jgi:hypothetical protein